MRHGARGCAYRLFDTGSAAGGTITLTTVIAIFLSDHKSAESPTRT